ncbi:hypothetical protein BKA56DRAFT_151720 [Ilyonectria sp. MPI-CAGE-AT-0026]|nr:hypothetical protein BKA56DRAFT_151720 [Ilyonectria sp. MPI-CAGE-AT-0026]
MRGMAYRHDMECTENSRGTLQTAVESQGAVQRCADQDYQSGSWIRPRLQHSSDRCALPALSHLVHLSTTVPCLGGRLRLRLRPRLALLQFRSSRPPILRSPHGELDCLKLTCVLPTPLRRHPPPPPPGRNRCSAPATTWGLSLPLTSCSASPVPCLGLALTYPPPLKSLQTLRILQTLQTLPTYPTSPPSLPALTACPHCLSAYLLSNF